ncbi:MAG: hypothetical protein V3S01_10575, partial [Dehalococcoidia bacterium]
MTIRHFGYLQNGPYGAVAPDAGTRQGEVDLAKEAKRAIRRRVAEYGPSFREDCPDLIKRMKYTNRQMAKIQKLWRAKAEKPMKKLDKVRAEIRATQNTLRNLDATRSALNWMFGGPLSYAPATARAIIHGRLQEPTRELDTAADKLDAAVAHVDAL